MFKKLQTLLLVVFLLPAGAFAQSGAITGVVTDASSGDPLPGTNVLIVELNRGAATDTDGEYSIAGIPAGTYTVRANFVGFSRFETTVEVGTGIVTLNIELQPDILGLDELVVTGTGTQVDRANLTQSISKVSSQQIENVSVTSTDALLQGRAAGVVVTSSSGAPGSGISVRIRGSSSISASNEPLYVVDGVPVTTGDFGSIFTGGQGLNTLADINPEDIESIEVLKDASATAVYGARGANGVVLINTKRGNSGQTQFSATYSYGIKENNRNDEVEFLSGPEHVRALVEGAWMDYFYDFGNFGGFDNFEDTDYQERLADVRAATPLLFGTAFENVVSPNISPFLDDPSTAPTTDFVDAIFREGETQRFNLSANGGNENTRFFVSGTYYDEKGVLINNDFERLNGRINLDHTFNEDLNFGASVSYNRADNFRIENDNNIFGVITNAFLATPTAPIRLDDGSFNPAAGPFSNSVAESEVINQATTTRFIGNAFFNWNVYKNFSVGGKAGLDRFDLDENTFNPSFTNQGSPLGNAFAALTINQRWFTELRASYTNTFNRVHDLDAIALLSYEENDVDDQQTEGNDFPNDNLRTINSAATTEGTSFATSFGLVSWTGRVNYGYDSRYLVTLSGRYDASSRFGDENQWGFFPSASVAWRISNESFMENVDFVDELKLRLSAGITGNQGIGNFASLALFGGAGYNARPGLQPTQLPNPDLQWEETEEFNIGLDFTVLNERVDASVDFYQRDTNDLLLNAPIPATTGFTTQNLNVGGIENTGLEIRLSTINVNQRNFQWTTTLTLSTNSNEVTSLVNDEPFSSGFANRVAVGEPLGAFFGFVSDGIFRDADDVANSPTQDGATPGSIKFKDLDGNGVINNDDQEIIGNANPDWFGGFASNFKYKNIELDAFFQFSLGNDVYNNSESFYGRPGFIAEWAVYDDALDRWTPTNRDAELPRASFLDSGNNFRDSDFFLDDGSYLRLKTLRLTYSVKRDVLNKIGLRSLQVFGTAQNVFTITGYDGFDPEVNVFDRSNTAFGTDFFTQPQSRSWEFGINVGF